jgi:hypothetical protein
MTEVQQLASVAWRVTRAVAPEDHPLGYSSTTTVCCIHLMRALVTRLSTATAQLTFNRFKYVLISCDNWCNCCHGPRSRRLQQPVGRARPATAMLTPSIRLCSPTHGRAAVDAPARPHKPRGDSQARSSSGATAVVLPDGRESCRPQFQLPIYHYPFAAGSVSDWQRMYLITASHRDDLNALKSSRQMIKTAMQQSKTEFAR